MKPLKNNRHERFAQAVFSGMIAKDATLESGYIYKNIDAVKNDAVLRATASRLLANVNIQARIKELQNAKAEKIISEAVMPVQERLQRLSLFSREDLQGKHGPVRHSNIAAIREINLMESIYTTPPDTGATVINSFTFILPDGTKVRPKELLNINPVETDAIDPEDDTIC